MKLSFSLPPKSKSRVTLNYDGNQNVGEGNIKKFVTEFDPSETLTDAKLIYVIPPIENRRKPYKEIKNTDHLLQSASSGLQFESEIPSVDAHVSSDNITYGLNLRQKVEAASKPEHVEQTILKNMRKDLDSLPDAPELEDFESFPVDGFGAALLAGYGWKPGQGVGLNAKEDVQIPECNKWNGTEGLGFNPDKPRGEGTKARGKIIEQLGSGSHEEVKVGIKEITNVEKDRVMSKRSRKRETASHIEVRACKQNYRGQSRDQKVSWLRSHIKVRIISNGVKGGRLYLKKGVVTDVVGPKTCDITMDETQELVQGIDQKLLETALPRRGGRVLVLSGRHKGLYGSLVEKDLDKETGVVCDADSQEMLHVKLEQVAVLDKLLDDQGRWWSKMEVVKNGDCQKWEVDFVVNNFGSLIHTSPNPSHLPYKYSLSL